MPLLGRFNGVVKLLKFGRFSARGVSADVFQSWLDLIHFGRIHSLGN